MTAPDRSFLIRSTADIVAVTPYLLGFHPADSLVVVGMAGGRIVFGARNDLPPPPPDELAATVVAQGVRSAAVLGYGPPAAVTPAVLLCAVALRAAGVQVHEMLRVTGDRWWSYGCDKPGCCPPEGNPCPPPTGEVAAEAVFRGMVALPDRQALVAQVAPVEGEARAAMRAATDRAVSRMTDLVGRDLQAGRSGGLVRRDGRAAMREAERRSRAGRALTDDEAAWLGVLLTDAVVHDYALDRSDGLPWRVRLWAEVTRRVDPAHAAGPACLLAHAAWRAGDGALARVAVDRALKESPGHPTAEMLDDLLCAAVGPHTAGHRGIGRRSS